MNNLKYIDIHTHGAYGIDFNSANYDEIKFLLSRFYQKNIKAICPTLVGDVASNIQRQLQIFKKIKNEQLKTKTQEAFLLGAHLEGSFLSPNKAGIQNKDCFLKPTVANFSSLVGDFEDVVKIVTIAPEEDIDLIDYLNNSGIITQAGHTSGDSYKNCKGVTHLFNAMNQIHHRIPSVALSALISDDIYCETIADLKHLSKDILKLVFKSKPTDKILLVSDCLPVAGYDKNIIFCNKEINTCAKDEFGNLAGSNMSLDEICSNLLLSGILNEREILRMAFYNQIKYLNLSNVEIDILNS